MYNSCAGEEEESIGIGEHYILCLMHYLRNNSSILSLFLNSYDWRLKSQSLPWSGLFSQACIFVFSPQFKPIVCVWFQMTLLAWQCLQTYVKTESTASIVTESGTLEASVKSVFQSFCHQKSAIASIIWEKIESVQSAFAATGNSGACGRKEKKHKSQLYLQSSCPDGTGDFRRKSYIEGKRRKERWGKQEGRNAFQCDYPLRINMEVRGWVPWGFTNTLNQKAKPHHERCKSEILESCPAPSYCIRLLSAFSC